MHDIKSLIADGKIDSSTLTFNNLVPTIEEMNDQWVVPANESWLKRYFI